MCLPAVAVSFIFINSSGSIKQRAIIILSPLSTVLFAPRMYHLPFLVSVEIIAGMMLIYMMVCQITAIKTDLYLPLGHNLLMPTSIQFKVLFTTNTKMLKSGLTNRLFKSLRT